MRLHRIQQRTNRKQKKLIKIKNLFFKQLRRKWTFLNHIEQNNDITQIMRGIQFRSFFNLFNQLEEQLFSNCWAIDSVPPSRAIIIQKLGYSVLFFIFVLQAGFLILTVFKSSWIHSSCTFRTGSSDMYPWKRMGFVGIPLLYSNLWKTSQTTICKYRTKNRKDSWGIESETS